MSVRGEGLSKSFSAVRSLDNVSLEVADGKIHALLGANGSGKSTLVKILSGVHHNDAGAIVVSGRRLRSIQSPAEARSLGIAVVHQEAPLIDSSSVAECVALFRGYPTRRGLVHWRALERDVVAMMSRFNVAIDPRRLAGTLSPAERAMVSLAIALDGAASNISLLVLDEVTASLPRDEAEPYLQRVAELAHSGIGVLMVTHRLAEVRDRADSMTILREGKVVYEGAPRDMNDEEIVGMIVGPGAPANVANRAASTVEPTSARRSAGALMKIEHLAGKLVRDVSLELYAGEILGIAGLADTGAAELPNILSGESARRSGRISVKGRALDARKGPRAFIKAGVVVLPADRLRAGGIGSLSVSENILLPHLGRFWGRPGAERRHIEALVETFDVRPRAASTRFGKLSGGNQQKALLAKWLDTKPLVLVLDDPTSGVDPGARERIFAALRSVASEGVGILFFSTEPEQLAAMCARVLVLKEGSVAKELSGAELTHQSISRWCYA